MDALPATLSAFCSSSEAQPQSHTLEDTGSQPRWHTGSPGELPKPVVALPSPESAVRPQALQFGEAEKHGWRGGWHVEAQWRLRNIA